MLDLNNAPEQRSTDLIPANTICTVQISVRPGGVGPEGLLKRSKDGGSESLDCELTVVDGQHAKRKLWDLMLVQGTTEGHKKASEITAGKLRGILESARGIKPDNKSPEARAARTMQSYGELDGLRFVAKIGIEKGENNYPDKNKLLEAITPDKVTWRQPDQITKALQGTLPNMGAAPGAQPAANGTPGMNRPEWST